MDKPTKQGPADLGLRVPGTDEYKRADEALEAIRKAEEADPELKRKDQKRNADLQAAYNRFCGRNPSEAGRQEDLLRDARKYAESYLAEASSPEGRRKITRQIWNEFIPKHPNREAFRLEFARLHTAIWDEGYLSAGEHSNYTEFGMAATAAKSDRTGRKRGPETDYKTAARVAEIVERVAPDGDWKSKLDDVLMALDEANTLDNPIPTPRTWKPKHGYRDWYAAVASDTAARGRHMAIEAIKHHLKRAKEQPTQTIL
jgi:hypothetical protein